MRGAKTLHGREGEERVERHRHGNAEKTESKLGTLRKTTWLKREA